MIPKLIHQIWLDGKLPACYERLAERVRALHPDFEYRLWSKADKPVLINQEVYEELSSAGRHDLACDVFRYELMARYGGVYLDMDFFLIRSIEELLEDEDLLITIEFHEWYTNAFIAARPNHPFMWDVVRELPYRYHTYVAAGRDPMDGTGPNLVTSLVQSGRFDVHLLPPRLLMAYHGEPIGEALRQPPDRLGLHLWGHHGLEAIESRVSALEQIFPVYEPT